MKTTLKILQKYDSFGRFARSVTPWIIEETRINPNLWDRLWKKEPGIFLWGCDAEEPKFWIGLAPQQERKYISKFEVFIAKENKRQEKLAKIEANQETGKRWLDAYNEKQEEKTNLVYADAF